jgi:hypothetical protein
MIRLSIQSVGKQYRRDFWRLDDYQIAGSGPTPRALGGGASAAPSGIFLASGFRCPRTLSTSAPPPVTLTVGRLDIAFAWPRSFIQTHSKSDWR